MLDHLARYAAVLHSAYQSWAEAAAQDDLLPFAAEWLLDNYYLVRQALRQIEEDLPPTYYAELPLIPEETTGLQLPRVYAVARVLVQHGTLQIGFENEIQFLQAYQTETPLTIGELWAVPALLRYALIERLAVAAARLTQQGDALPVETAGPTFDGAPAADDDSIVADAILGLRAIHSAGWLDFFEAVSLVHHTLTQDPANVYAAMTSGTRDRYRAEVEHLARYSGRSEVQVAALAVETADQAAHLPDGRARHVGYYLVGPGRAQFESALGYAPPARYRLRRWIYAHPTGFYLGSIGLLSAAALLGLFFIILAAPPATGWQVILGLVLGVIPALTLAVSLVNWAVTLILPPRILPKLELEQGVPAEARTMVVIPALLSHPEDVDDLFRQLELHYLRNMDPNGHVGFGLLTDFSDAATATRPEDDGLLALAHAALQRLNRQYPGQPFYFFHRKRLWNPSEGVWMGWERKRGKLHEFNRLLRAPFDAATGTLGEHGTSFSVLEGDLSLLAQVRYVITLDADTVLPRDAARRLVATLAHPLNRAEFDPASGRVVAGYTVLQPRTEINVTSIARSFFTQVFAGDTGIDLYTLAVSDVYQDLFGEGIYVGKGIYDVDAFERSLAGRVPENALLSHDLFEGIHGRAGLVTDIVLFEDYPPHYLVHMRRMRRWTRGDWQLLPWLGRRVPYEDGFAPNPLSPIARWKIVDNLRRSLLSPLLLVWFVAGWTILPGSPWLWTLIGFLIPGVPVLTSLLETGVRAVRADDHRTSLRPWRKSVARWLLYMVFLPYEAVLNIYAIGLTLYRLAISRRHLLQWVTSAHTVRLLGENSQLDATLQWMVPSLLALLPIAWLTIWLRPGALPAAVPLWLVWAVAPLIAHFISRPRVAAPYTPDAQEIQQLRTLARRTWLFYEQFVGPEDNWLPPDHFQESPKGVVAHRTSPTNIGLYLLSVLAAHDLGYANTMTLTLRLRSAFDTLARLDLHRGHILNWFATHDLSVLTPAYVSTVDSGNLAAALVALKQGCQELLHQPLQRWELWQGFVDALALLVEEVNAVVAEEGDEAGQARQARRDLLQEIERWRTLIAAARQEPQHWLGLAQQLAQQERPKLDQAMLAFVDAHPEALDADRLQTLSTYNVMLHRQLSYLQHELGLLAPWQRLLDAPPRLLDTVVLDAGVLPGSLRQSWRLLQRRLPANPTLLEAETGYGDALAVLEPLQAALEALAEQPASQSTAAHGGSDDLHAQIERAQIEEAVTWSREMREALQTAQESLQTLHASLAAIAEEAARWVAEMDFSFLFDAQRKLFYIGYNVTAGRYDANYYDLLASEARLASLVAIAKYDVPQRHWLQMGRPMTMLDGRPVLLSWSGTMFEYLMPLLLARSYPGTLLHESCLAAVECQRRHGQAHHVPWGVSESGFYQFDSALNYQYRAFGVPGLGLKRGLDEDLVIAPYASLMAVGLAPEAVLRNLERLQADQLQGRYGLYEAADYTEKRLPVGQKKGVVRSYMAHHQGMILLALANYLQGERMVQRFHADPTIQSVDLLLQEQVPATPVVDALTQTQATAPLHVGAPSASTQPWRVPLESPVPLAHLLANGRFATVITNSGSGFSTWNNLSLTRWRPDPTLDDWGTWVYLHDLTTGDVWSVGRQPLGAAQESEEVLFYPHMAEFRHRRGPLGVQMEVTVAPDVDVEIRRITLTNGGDTPQRLRVTSYAEVALGDAAADLRHPAFAKLFVESEYLPQYNALLFRRRPRSGSERPQYMAHALVIPSGKRTGAHESDRARFLGRGRTARRPSAIGGADWLSGTTGATLDPIMALGQEVEIAPYAMAEVTLITAAGQTRQEVYRLLARFQIESTLSLVFTAARIQADQWWREQELAAGDLAVFDQMLALLLYPHAAGRADPAILAENRLGQPGLWPFGISGDYPIVLAQIQDAEQSPLLRRLIQAHTYWRRRGLMVDLVIANQEESNYGQAVQGAIWRLLQRMDADQAINQRGGIFIVRRDQMRPDEYTLLQTAARVVVDGERGSLEDQLGALASMPGTLPDLIPSLPPDANAGPMPALQRPADLHFDNGWGGFSPDGREYVIYLKPGDMPPAPWINVVANQEFGFLASESGGGYSWAVNSGENRLTAWRNDPVSDLPSEALYLRDEETGQVWSPMPLPAPASAPYLVRHGAGYTGYEHHSHGLAQQVRLYAAPDAPLKYIRIRLRNYLPRTRRLTVTYYAEWVLGVNRALTTPTILQEVSGDRSPALFATNPYHSEFAAGVAFVATDKPVHGFGTDRTEFLGRNGDYAQPAALRRIGLSGQVQPGQDPCAALQVHVDLPPDGEEEFVFVLGQGSSRAEAQDLVRRFVTLEAAETAWAATTDTWQAILDTVQVETPEPSMDLLLNRWLLYQALACRLWARSALYQSSGAYGFRDQLQDVLALLYARPDLVRAQLLRAARHQFDAGDVLHWWHPPSGRGVRTRISDDLLWLPYVTAQYIGATGDLGVLDEEVPFLQGEPLRPGEDERYAEYQASDQVFTLYEHCVRALTQGATRGPHGLPLMGTGDWNDGMNRVGVEGQGESIWLAWFLYATQTAFAGVAEAAARPEDAQRLRDCAAELRQAVETHGWDGDWYLRAYYDDGTPLGSARNQECRIDSIAQSWAVLSGAADPERARQAMQAVRSHLVKRDERLILLFTPPFNKTRRDPGYIKGYLPGVRENGGQYTHAALWSIWAWTQLGEGTFAQTLFQMINPITRAGSAAAAAVYKVEPYVISADVYGVAPHTGRGGWTWYTGSSGWMYRLGIEAMLGLRRDAHHLWLEPCIPDDWPGFKLRYRLGRTCYCFTVENPDRVQRGCAILRMDGQLLPEGRVPLVDDGREHHITVVLRRDGDV